jgi:hypothetical protein
MNTHAVILICLVIIEFDCMYVFLRKNQHYMAIFIASKVCYICLSFDKGLAVTSGFHSR